MNLPSMKQQHSTSNKRDPVPIFYRKGNANAFYKGIKDKCILHYGEVGQNVIQDILFPTTNLGIMPHHNDRRLNPVTGKPIENQRKYPREQYFTPEPTGRTELHPNVTARKSSEFSLSSSSSTSAENLEAEEQEDEETKTFKMAASSIPRFIDEDEIPLTEAGQAKLDKDVANFEKKQELLEAKQKIHKDNDDACAAMIIEHIGAERMQEIEVQPKYSEWKALAHKCTDRSVLFLRMHKMLFSTGNSSDAVDAMTHLFNLKQPQDQAHPSTFLNAVTDAFSATIGLIQDPKNAGMINGLQIQSMVIINGLNKSSSANKKGIKTHLADHPDDALLKPGELVAAILKAHMSDLNTDRVSEQSSAFAAIHTAAKTPFKKAITKKAAISAWAWHEDNADNSEIPGFVHCANCKTLTKKFFYSHPTEKCRRTAASEEARIQRKNAKLHAKIAAVEDPPPPTANDYESLKSAYDEMTAFMAEHHPEAFEA